MATKNIKKRAFFDIKVDTTEMHINSRSYTCSNMKDAVLFVILEKNQIGKLKMFSLFFIVIIIHCIWYLRMWLFTTVNSQIPNMWLFTIVNSQIPNMWLFTTVNRHFTNMSLFTAVNRHITHMSLFTTVNRHIANILYVIIYNCKQSIFQTIDYLQIQAVAYQN